MPDVVTQTFIPGPRLIDGSDLNQLVSQVNTGFDSVNTGGTLTDATLINPTISGGTITNAIQNGNVRCTSTLTAQTNSTLAAITGLSVTVTSGGVYNLRIRLNGTAGASGGLKVAMGGTATVSQSNVTAWNYNTTTINAVTNQTTWGSNITAATAIFTDLIAEGSFVVTTGGTVTVQAAQNATNGTATTVLPGSFMTIGRIS